MPERSASSGSLRLFLSSLCASRSCGVRGEGGGRNAGRTPSRSDGRRLSGERDADLALDEKPVSADRLEAVAELLKDRPKVSDKFRLSLEDALLLGGESVERSQEVPFYMQRLLRSRGNAVRPEAD